MMNTIVAPRFGRTLFIGSDGILYMHDISANQVFMPRSYEIGLILSGEYYILDEQYDATAIKSVRDISTIGRAVDCFVAGLDATLAETSRSVAIKAAEALASEEAIFNGIRRTILSVPLSDTPCIDFKAAIRLVNENHFPRMLELYNELGKNINTINNIYAEIATSISASPVPILRDEVTMILKESRVVADILDNRSDIRSDIDLYQRIDLTMQTLPITSEELSALTRILYEVLRGFRNRIVHGESSNEANVASDPASEKAEVTSEVSTINHSDPASAKVEVTLKIMELSYRVGCDLRSLFDAGSQDENVWRWEYMLDIGLLANPNHKYLWDAKLLCRKISGDTESALSAFNTATSILSISAVDWNLFKSMLFEDNRLYEASALKLWISNRFCDQCNKSPAQYKYKGDKYKDELMRAIEKAIESDDFSYSVRSMTLHDCITGLLSSNWLTRDVRNHLFYLLTDKKKSGYRMASSFCAHRLQFVKEVISKSHVKPGSDHSLGSGSDAISNMCYLYNQQDLLYSRNDAYLRKITPALLLHSLEDYADCIRQIKSLHSANALPQLLTIIDQVSPITPEENKHYRSSLKSSEFYKENQERIEAISDDVPKTGIDLLGKLILRQAA